ncbi:MAG TPA: NOB1 family endonuclease [Thermoplasmatales archaeon]|nr:NOB1 family endonuclease [Thermoplasmatales archaeon]
MTVFVLDTSAVLSGKPIVLFDEEMVTVPSVEKETAKDEEDHRIFRYLVERGLKVFIPSRESVKVVEKAAEKSGDSNRLSKVDKELLALAVDFKKKDEVCLLTDDYSMQNVAELLGIKYEGVSQRGISKRFVWVYRCMGCKKVFKEYMSSCPVCGSPLKMVVKKRFSLNKKR